MGAGWGWGVRELTWALNISRKHEKTCARQQRTFIEHQSPPPRSPQSDDGVAGGPISADSGGSRWDWSCRGKWEAGGPDSWGRGIVGLTWASLSLNQQPQGSKTPSPPNPPFAKLTKTSYFYIHVHAELESSPVSLARILGVASHARIALGGCRAPPCPWCSRLE